MRRGCQALELSVALNRALVTGELKPSDVLVRNEVGNLAIERGGVYVGYVDVMFGEVDVFDEYVMMDARDHEGPCLRRGQLDADCGCA
jgi:hypothetical protein